MAVYWGEKRYHSLDYYLKNTYGSKLYKLSLNGGMTCPNRDGTCGTRGCIFCSHGGSGDLPNHLPRRFVNRLNMENLKSPPNMEAVLILHTSKHIRTLMHL